MNDGYEDERVQRGRGVGFEICGEDSRDVDCCFNFLGKGNTHLEIRRVVKIEVEVDERWWRREERLLSSRIRVEPLDARPWLSIQ